MPGVSERPVKTGPYAEFGGWLRQRRERSKHKSQLNSQRRSPGLGISSITQGKLSHIERGLNQNPEPDLLRGIAVLYETPYEEIVSRWVECRFGVSVTLASQGESQEEQRLARPGNPRQDSEDPSVKPDFVSAGSVQSSIGHTRPGQEGLPDIVGYTVDTHRSTEPALAKAVQSTHDVGQLLVVHGTQLAELGREILRRQIAALSRSESDGVGDRSQSG
jgi:hypothetical protein